MPRSPSRSASVSAGLSTRPGLSADPTPYARRVLDCVERIPRGFVLTYGDVAEYVGGGSGRVVGNVLHHHGHEVAWWRVLLATGHPNPASPVKAAEKLRDEGVPFLRGGERVDLPAARWDGTRTSPRRRR
ncbi:MAG: MGMT family protein [Mycobacteriales bacterium]